MDLKGSLMLAVLWIPGCGDFRAETGNSAEIAGKCIKLIFKWLVLIWISFFQDVAGTNAMSSN